MKSTHTHKHTSNTITKRYGKHQKHTFNYHFTVVINGAGILYINRDVITCSIKGWYQVAVVGAASGETRVAQLTLPSHKLETSLVGSHYSCNTHHINSRYPECHVFLFARRRPCINAMHRGSIVGGSTTCINFIKEFSIPTTMLVYNKQESQR